jgi:D-3-phosphoglycerate dehydrogenase
VSGDAPVVLAGVGAGFPDVSFERSVLAEVGAEVVDAREFTVDQVIEHARGADAVMTDYFEWSADAIAELGSCRVISQYGVGYDKIDVGAAERAGILVTHTPDYCAEEMADHAVALMLAVVRKVAFYDRAVRAGEWDYNAGPEMRRMSALTLGLVGAGRVGSAVAARARAFGMRVVAHDPQRDAADLARDGIEAIGLDEVIRTADLLSLHLPLTAGTRGFMTTDRLVSMKPGAVLLNTARGGLVDHDALTSALRDGSLGGAGLDVLAAEPPRPDDPRLSLENVVVTPHAGFLSREALEAVQVQAAEEARRVLAGEPPRHPVNSPRRSASPR